MKRDMGLIRLLLLRLEELDQDGQSVYHFREGDPDIDIEGYSWEQISYHYDLADEAGLVDMGSDGIMNGFLFRRLTWAGHDFVDAVRDEEIWRKTKEGALAAGGISIDLVKDLAKGFVRKNIEKLTGIEL
jgi:DNA-binding transcriptional ArsR family regulator